MLNEHLEFFCDLVGLDIEQLAKPQKSNKINLALYHTHRQLLKAYTYLNLGKEGFALHLLHEIVHSILEILKSQDTDWFLENIDLFKEAAVRVKQISALHSEWLQGDFTIYLSSFQSQQFFLDGEIVAAKVSPDLILAAEDHETAGLLNTFCYQSGEPVKELSLGVSFRISENIFILDSLQDFFRYLKHNTLATDVLHVHFLMKEEERIDLSYFLIAFSYRGNVWLATDMCTDFRNPMNKATTRKPVRRREKYYDALHFPYQLIDQLSNIKKKGKKLVRLDEKSFQIFSHPFTDIPVEQRIFFIALVQRLIPTLPASNASLLTLSEHLDQKLIESGKDEFILETENPEDFTGWDDHIKAIAQDLIQHAQENSNSLIVLSKEVIKENEYFDADWLGTPQQLDTILKWMSLDTKANDFKAKVKDTERFYDSDKIKLDALLNSPDNLTRIWKYLFNGDEVYFMVEDGLEREKYGFHQTSVPRPYKLKYSGMLANRYRPEFILGNSIADREARAVVWRKDRKISDRISLQDFLWKPLCTCCRKVKASRQFDLNVDHYKELMFLTRLDREQLPLYYRFYRSHLLIPYHGNSILDNVHPFAMIEHPSWNKYPNGIFIQVFLCKRCCKKLKAQYFISEKTVILPDHSIRRMNSNDKTMEIIW